MTETRIQKLIGLTEAELIETQDRSDMIVEENGKKYFKHPNGALTPIGTFTTPSLLELKMLQKGADMRSKPLPLDILTNIDVGELQPRLKTDRKPMVQVASNFNCLEVPGRNFYPDSGHLVENAHNDGTQGPAAAFGPLADYLYRTHFVFPDNKGQTKKEQVNLLEDVESYFGSPVNGKMCLTGKEAPIQDMDKVANLIRCGIVEDCQVLYDRSGPIQNGPVISQLYTASISYPFNKRIYPQAYLYTITRTILRAAYENTYFAAIKLGCKELYLTLIGGGSFGNPISMILEEMVRAHKNATRLSSCRLEKVYLCLYKYDDAKYISERVSELMQ